MFLNEHILKVSKTLKEKKKFKSLDYNYTENIQTLRLILIMPVVIETLEN